MFHSSVTEANVPDYPDSESPYIDNHNFGVVCIPFWLKRCLVGPSSDFNEIHTLNLIFVFYAYMLGLVIRRANSAIHLIAITSVTSILV